MTSTITEQQRQAIAEFVTTHHIPSGLGTEEAACSLAAINLALNGTLTDTIPDCMSSVIGSWIIAVQDAMPDDMRNGAGWKSLLPLAAGTGRAHEQERLKVLLDWMWDSLSALQPMGNQYGYGEKWSIMLSERTVEAAKAAKVAAYAATDAAYAAYAATDAAYAAYAATDAAYAATFAAEAADAATFAAEAAYAATFAAKAAAFAADAATFAAEAAARVKFWVKANPPAVLAKLVAVGDVE